jgi:hypothetical protein
MNQKNLIYRNSACFIVLWKESLNIDSVNNSTNINKTNNHFSPKKNQEILRLKCRSLLGTFINLQIRKVLIYHIKKVICELQS